jgi:hypothetical protein
MDMSDMDDILDNVLVKRRTQTKTTNLNEKIYITDLITIYYLSNVYNIRHNNDLLRYYI